MSKITTIQQCDDFYYPEKMVIKGMPEDTVYPLPAGTPFFICYLAYDFTDKRNPRRHGIYGTHDIDIRDQRAAYERMRTYEFKHLIPRLGKSINKHSYPVGSVMLIAKVDEQGVKHWVPHRCDCGGKYIRSVTGEFFCDECGVEYSWVADEDNARKTSFFDNLDESEFQDTYSDYTVQDDDSEEIFTGIADRAGDFTQGSGMASFYQGEQLLGSTEHPKMQFLLDRVTRNIIEWRNVCQLPPEDEVRSRAILHAKVVATDKAKKQIRKDSVYVSRINKVKSDERKGLILHHIKVDNVHTAAEITRVTGLHRTTVVRLLTALEASGRLVSRPDESDARGKVYELI
jgi:hypothetical protein